MAWYYKRAKFLFDWVRKSKFPPLGINPCTSNVMVLPSSSTSSSTAYCHNSSVVPNQLIKLRWRWWPGSSAIVLFSSKFGNTTGSLLSRSSSPLPSSSLFLGASSSRRYYSLNSGKYFRLMRRIYTCKWKWLLGSAGILIAGYFVTTETIPFTKRRHFVLLTEKVANWWGELKFEKVKEEEFKGKILPLTHRDSIKVRLIANDIIDALERRLNHEQISSACLEGLEWEVLVVDEPEVICALYLPHGKIVVYSGSFNICRTDAEIALLIGRNVAHIVARHLAEWWMKFVWLGIVTLMPNRVVGPYYGTYNVAFFAYLFWWISRLKCLEFEADYIGFLLAASAGYDPREALSGWQRLGKLQLQQENSSFTSLMEYLCSNRPTWKACAQLLARPQVMEEAMGLYREAKAQKRGKFARGVWRDLARHLKLKYYGET